MKHSAKREFSDRANLHEAEVPAGLSSLPATAEDLAPEPVVGAWPGAVRLAILLSGALLSWSMIATVATRL